MIAVAANVFEMEAIGNTVWAVTGSGSSTLVTPKPRTVVTPLATIPSATPGMRYSRILSWTRAASGSKRASAAGVCATRGAATAIHDTRPATARIVLIDDARIIPAIRGNARALKFEV